jgi:hypothetical protein
MISATRTITLEAPPFRETGVSAVQKGRRLPQQVMSEGDMDHDLNRGLVELPVFGEGIGRLMHVRNGISALDLLKASRTIHYGFKGLVFSVHGLITLESFSRPVQPG